MNNPASVLENDTHKLPWDFDTKTDLLTSAWRPDQLIVNKKKKEDKVVDFVVQADHRIKLKECEKKEKYPDPAK